jgi:DNA-binding transcriptional ArsR family regulator
MQAGGLLDPGARLADRMAERIADTMFALSTPSRLQILVCPRSGPRTVSEIVDAVGMEQSAVSHQLRVLRDHSVLRMRRIGRTRQYARRRRARRGAHRRRARARPRA